MLQKCNNGHSQMEFIWTGIASVLYAHKYNGKHMTQYSKRVVIIHWLTLVLLIVAWLLGNNSADATDAGKATLQGYLVHVLVGVTILLLTIARLLFRIKDGAPPPAGKTFMDKVAKGINYSLYAVLFILPVSGVVTILTGDTVKALLVGDANLLPKEDGYKDVFAHEVHEVLVTVLFVLVALHLLGAIKHQFIMKDGSMKRMSLRRTN